MTQFYNGMIIYAPIFGAIEHPGVVVWDGHEWKIIHNSFWNGVIISSIDDFRNGKNIYLSKRYLTHRPPHVITKQAWAKLGQKWQIDYNCQHFVSDCCGLKLESHDYEFIKLIGILGISAILLK